MTRRSHGTRGRILTFRTDRLGLRLQNVILGQRLGEVFDTDVLHLWPLRENAPELANPKELFASAFVDQRFETDAARIAALTDAAAPFRQFTCVQEIAACLDAGTDVVVVGFPDGALPALPGEAPEHAAAEFQRHARALALSAPLVERAASQLARLSTRTVHALHIRRGDIILKPVFSRAFWPTKYVPDAYYDAYIRANPDVEFLLFTDTPATQARFGKIYGIAAAADILDQSGLTEAQSALLEILTISRCARVVAGSDSGFSSVAARFGGVERYALPDNMPPDLRRTAETDLLARVAQGAEAFLNVQDFGQSAHWALRVLQDRGAADQAQGLQRDIIAREYNIPHITQPLLSQAIRNRDDAMVIALTRSRNAETRYIFSQARTRRKAPDHLSRYFLAAQAFAGMGKPRLAAQTLLNAIVIQNAPGCLDLLSAALATDLENGQGHCPPTTLLPRAAGQGTPKPPAFLRTFGAAFAERFEDGAQLLNWETAQQLDWQPLMVRGGFDPDPETLRIIAETGLQGGPMQQSLAALALLRLGDSAEAHGQMRRISQGPLSVSEADYALLCKRFAACALELGQFSAAETAMQHCFAHSAHPAFVSWWAWAEARQGLTRRAIDRLTTLTPRPIYAQLLMFDLIQTSGMARDELPGLKGEIRKSLAIAPVETLDPKETQAPDRRIGFAVAEPQLSQAN